MIDSLESFATPAVSWLWHLCCDATLWILFVWLVLQIVRGLKPPAWFEHWCWRLVFVKLLLACVIWQPLEVPILPAGPSTSSVKIAPPSAADRTGFDFGAASMNQVDQPVVSVPVTVASVSEARISWQVGIVLFWLLGVFASAGILAWQFFQVCRLPLQPVTDVWLLDRCHQLSKVVGVRTPQLMTCSRLHSPSLIGFLQTSIVFPPQAIAQCGPSEMNAILYHELAHVRRRDLWWNLLPAAIHVLLYFHPLVWLARSRWQLTREQACDAQAIDHLDDSVLVYANSLLRIAELVSDRVQSERLLGCVSIFHSSSALEQRLVAMNGYQKSSWKKSWILASCLAVVGTVATIPWTPVNRAQAALNPAEGEEAAAPELGRNLDFEDKSEAGYPDDWSGGSEHFVLSLDTEQPFRGQSSGRIKGDGEGRFSTITQSIKADSFRGKRIQYTGYMRTDLGNDASKGQLWMRVDADLTPVAFDNMNSRAVKGKTAWKQYSIVLNVPVEATNITFGVMMFGAGSIWIDAMEIKLAAQDAEVTGLKVLPLYSLANGDFEQARQDDPSKASNWGGGGKGFELIRDTDVKHSGTASARIRQLESTGVFGTFTAGFYPAKYQGKRVRFSGYIKTEDAHSAGLWMRVDGPKQTVLAFDNMQERAISGTNDWKKYEVVLDVPKLASNVNLGFLSTGKGTIWADDLKLEVAPDADSTDMGVPVNIAEIRKREEFGNGDFEKAAPTSTGLMHWGGGGKGYRAARDEAVKYSGAASARISQEDASGRYGSFTQSFPAAKYHGKRIRLRGYLKSEDADSAGLWMRIDGPLSGRIVRGHPLKKVLRFDRMEDRPVTGTSDWASHDVILDVPPTATKIFVGFFLDGKGKVWGDELALEIIGDMGEGPATTNVK